MEQNLMPGATTLNYTERIVRDCILLKLPEKVVNNSIEIIIQLKY